MTNFFSHSSRSSNDDKRATYISVFLSHSVCDKIYPASNNPATRREVNSSAVTVLIIINSIRRENGRDINKNDFSLQCGCVHWKSRVHNDDYIIATEIDWTARSLIRVS